MSGSPGLRALFDALAAYPGHDVHDDIVRLVVRLRARDACEYCLLPTVGQFHVDHIVPPGLWDAYAAGRIPTVTPRTGRSGPEHLDNFAWCCPFCNGGKGQRVSRRVGAHAYGLYDPRADRWAEHFVFFHNFLTIIGLTGIGHATEAALRFNTGGLQGPLGPRHEAIVAGRYPPTWARGWSVTGL
ncbi:MAG: HNH endonuclease [Chloroflexi bacterium]|nr:HNH endonuclease [Chloroflexota bacterium]